MHEIKLIDEAKILSPYELERVKNFIIDKCLCTTQALKRLKHVKIRDDGNAGYSGYWSAKYKMKGADVTDVEAVIVLNAFYLKTPEQLEKTLAHEFGHHWTLGYYMDRYEMIGWFNEMAPRLYYRIRGLDPNQYAKDYSKGWSNCDKEVLAEDFKYLFSPYTGAHRMKTAVNNPMSEVKDYLWSLGRPGYL